MLKEWPSWLASLLVGAVLGVLTRLGGSSAYAAMLPLVFGLLTYVGLEATRAVRDSRRLGEAAALTRKALESSGTDLAVKLEAVRAFRDGVPAPPGVVKAPLVSWFCLGFLLGFVAWPRVQPRAPEPHPVLAMLADNRFTRVEAAKVGRLRLTLVRSNVSAGDADALIMAVVNPMFTNPLYGLDRAAARSAVIDSLIAQLTARDSVPKGAAPPGERSSVPAGRTAGSQ